VQSYQFQPSTLVVAPSPVPPTGIVWQTSFDIPEWTQGGGLNPLPANDEIAHWGDWLTNNGRGDQIIAAANNPLGTGNGFRHYRGDGVNNQGGGLKITPSRSLTEMWVRFYMRYSLGFKWDSGQPAYTKDHYWNSGGQYLIFGVQGALPAGGGHTWGITQISSPNLNSTLTWAASQGGVQGSALGDGQFHCYEYHVKQNGANGTLEYWFDGVAYGSRTANLGSTPWGSLTLGSNQTIVVGAEATDYYTDYDDIAISDTGRIGPLS